MNSMPSRPEDDADARSLRLPANGTTVVAEDLRTRLVMASDLDHEIIVDASDVETVGQAVLQLLVAARCEALRAGRFFAIANPSFAFSERVTACLLAGPLGLEIREGAFQ
ncbi:MAG: hypothetical protein JWO25_2834 [Alphaproteobacteria bacterium]|nr:hypothetical protein [Alphaproteobacteria bacterium]